MPIGQTSRPVLFSTAKTRLREPRFSKSETGIEGVEEAANKAWRWGTKKRFGGGADTLVGRCKEGVGRVTGDDDLAEEEVTDQAVGAMKDGAGRWGHAVGETIHDLNR